MGDFGYGDDLADGLGVTSDDLVPLEGIENLGAERPRRPRRRLSRQPPGRHPGPGRQHDADRPATRRAGRRFPAGPPCVAVMRCQIGTDVP